ncbi:nitrate- and nitrite sensing domain-containing protein [Streptomyces sp. NPDC026673]|uniref:nitrate- and nitrite sensing domain-containing protein n=1 Tax=Streptomyces sp. NPDC026673 TaxID=3155724 RepID=UPI0033CA635E
MRSRNWTIRRKITALLLLPLLSLAVLWSYAAYLSLGNALTLAHVDTMGNHLARPLGQVFISLQAERRTSVVLLASKRPAPESDTRGRSSYEGRTSTLSRSRDATDAALAQFLIHANDEDVRSDASPQVRKNIDAAQQALHGITELREQVDSHRISLAQAMEAYSKFNAMISEAFDAMTLLPDSKAQSFGQALYTHTLASDFLSQEDALISSVAVTGRMTPAIHTVLVQNIGASRYLNRLAMQSLPAAQRGPFERLAAPGGPLQRVAKMEDQIISAGTDARSLPFSVTQWRTAYDAQWAASNQLALDNISVVFTLTGPPAERALKELLIAGVLGLASLIISVILSVRIGRSLVGDVARLSESARNLTEDQLRDVVGRLRRGETVDIQDDMTRPEFVNREMAQLGDAFFALQTTAVDLAVEDVRLHRGINEVYVNLARRSQTLVHRQLGILDALERREEDPQRLSDLFSLDQIATRLRRYAEGLIIVSGSATGRIWRHSVPAVDVIRGAIAETEEYQRVTVLPVPDVAIAGRAVADVVHLLAELIENAENFSPDDSQVRVSVGIATNGLVLEIDDRGLGMNAEDIEKANARIDSHVDISALDSTRLGLATVGRLAKRHKIAVTLRKSPYGGVTAVVLIPQHLLDWEPHTASAPALPRTPDSDTVHARGLVQEKLLGAEQPLPQTVPVAEGSAGSAPGSMQARLREVPDVEAPSSFLPATAPSTALPQPPPLDHADAHRSDAETVDGLPRRVRQANLAPQLQVTGSLDTSPPAFDWSGSTPQHHAQPWQPPSPPGSFAHLESSVRHAGIPRAFPRGESTQPEASEALGNRSDQARSLMSALQAGSARGRLEWGESLRNGGHHQLTHPSVDSPEREGTR